MNDLINDLPEIILDHGREPEILVNVNLIIKVQRS